MATETVGDRVVRPHARIEQPYAPSWVNRLIDWIDRLPGPFWIFLLALLAFEFVLVNAVRWLDGSLPLGEFDIRQSYYVVFTAYLLGAMYYLNRTALRALDDFRPALTMSEPEYARLRYELTTLPARPVLIANLLSLLFVSIFIFGFPTQGVRAQLTSPLRAVIVVGISLNANVILATVFLLHALNQLRMVTRIHDRVTHLNLFQLTPVYAFSKQTAWIGFSVIVVLYLQTVGEPETLSNPTILTFGFAALAIAAASFLVPLWGMHERLVAEKERLEAKVNRRLEAVIAELHRNVDARQFGEADALNKTMASLVTEREVIAKIPTWPWQPDTLRGFITALLLPIVLWLITRVLERLIGPG